MPVHDVENMWFDRRTFQRTVRLPTETQIMKTFTQHLISLQQQQRQDALIESWACSLAEIYDVSRLQNLDCLQHLCAALIDHLGDPVDESDDTIVDAVESSSPSSSYIQQVAQKIIDLAYRKRQDRQDAGGVDTPGADASTNNATSACAAMSFSWFDQLQDTAPRVMVEDIQSAGSLQEQMQLLLRVEYVEDLSMDWNVVLPILQSGLQAEIQTTEQHDDGVNPSPILGLIKKWYRQCRSSSDLVSLQCDLCITLMEAILTSTQMPPDVVQLWLDVWIDIMIFSYDTFQPHLERMEWIALLWLRLKTDGKPETPCLLLSSLATLDPSAKWCSYWMMHFTCCPSRLLNLIQQSNAISYLFSRLHPSGSSSQQLGTSDAVRVHCLAIVCNILRTTRVCLFPWNTAHSSNDLPAQLSSGDITAILEKMTDRPSPQRFDHTQAVEPMNQSNEETGILLVFELLWNELMRIWKEEALEMKDNDLMDTFTDGLIAILRGCLTDAALRKSLLPSLLHKIRLGLNTMTGSVGADDSQQFHGNTRRDPGSARRLLIELAEMHDAKQTDEDTKRSLKETIDVWSRE